MTHLDVLDTLYTAVVADVLDRMGYRRQTLSSRVRALTPANRVSGRVYTARAVPVDRAPDEPYKLELAAVDAMAPGDVFVVDVGHHGGCAFWGELLSTACVAKGVRGVVMTGCTRDLWGLTPLGFPVFGIGTSPADSLGRIDVVSIGEPIEIDGVIARTGDYVLGDLDGVVVIPSEAAGEALRLAREKASGENTVRDELRAGRPVTEVFRDHGIL